MIFKTCLTAFVISLFLFGCKKGNDSDFFATKEDLKPLYIFPDRSSCVATKKIPGLGKIEWRANTFVTVKNGNILITFVTYQDSISFSIRERLAFRNIPLLKGIHKLANDVQMPISTYSRWLSDGDLLNAVWEVNTNANNIIEIQEIDTSTRNVKGLFNVHFIMTTQGSLDDVHSERINFEDGKFDIIY
jgi:hypothetical protein